MIRFCIILGAMKAGTTSLFNYLAQHPEISPCKEKEPNFFSHHYDIGINTYFDLWKKEDIDTKVLMEASTNYTKHPSFPDSSSNLLEFAQNHDVDIKFIYVMRDPIERLESQYTYSFARWSSQSLENRLQHGHLINVSRYAQQLDVYYEKFNHNDFLLLDFDDLIKKPKDLLKQICQFLNINDRFRFEDLGEVYNKSKGRPITRPIDKLYKKHPSAKSFARIFPKSFKRFLSKILFRKKISDNFKLTEQQKQYIHDALKEDMAQLHEKYSIDIKKWGFKKPPLLTL